MENKPYYWRDLSEFSDEVITIAREAESGLWYAVMNRPNNIHGRSMPDFSSCGRTREEAIAKCAQWIRNDEKGIGKYAPHGCLRPGYEFNWILKAHWARQMGEAVDAGRQDVEIMSLEDACKRIAADETEEEKANA